MTTTTKVKGIQKDFKIRNKKVKIVFTHKPYYKDKNTIVMGFPYNMDISKFDETKVNDTKGYYTYIKFTNDELILINDICGNYRTYYMEQNNVLYISNDFLYLFNLIEREKRTFNKFEFEYWEEHSYTTGEGTVCADIHKIKPAHIYKFTDNNVIEKLYFKKDVINKPNRKKCFNEVLSCLRDTVSQIKKLPQKKFLMFSGGADSTLCVKLLQEQNVDFTPVFVNLIPSNSEHYQDILKTKKSAVKLSINPIEIDVNITNQTDDAIIDMMFMDRMLPHLFFGLTEELKSKYGEDIILISGQSADSIFNLGNTAASYGCLIGRNLLFGDNIIRKVFHKLILHITRRDWYKGTRLPKKSEIFEAFLDLHKGKCLIDNFKSNEYKASLKNIVQKYSFYINDKYNLLTYLKILTHLQGSDNYVNVQSAEYEGMHLIFLFATPDLIYSTVKNTDYKYEIDHPKSVVYKILKDVYNYEMPNYKDCKNYKKELKEKQTYQQYEQDTHKMFFNKMELLEFSETIKKIK